MGSIVLYAESCLSRQFNVVYMYLQKFLLPVSSVHCLQASPSVLARNNSSANHLSLSTTICSVPGGASCFKTKYVYINYTVTCAIPCSSITNQVVWRILNVAHGYEFYLSAFNSRYQVEHSKDKIHIHKQACNILFTIQTPVKKAQFTM